MILREFFYLRKSDRKTILVLLCAIMVAFVLLYVGGGETTTNALTPVDTMATAYAPRQKTHQDDHRSRYRTNTVYVRTKVVYRDTAFSRGRSLHAETRDSLLVHRPQKISEGQVVVLNMADTMMLRTVPGIGPYFARKIVQYGKRLGGYVSVDQLDEIEDFPLDAKRFLVIENACPQLLNVNRLSLSELRRHPYINYYMARAITDYRRLHGPLKSLEDMRLSKDFPPEAIARLTPYVTF